MKPSRFKEKEEQGNLLQSSGSDSEEQSSYSSSYDDSEDEMPVNRAHTDNMGSPNVFAKLGHLYNDKEEP